MMQERKEKGMTDARVPFRVPLNPDQIVEICRRRNLRADRRTLAEWIEDGLQLALGQEMTRKTLTDVVRERGHVIELFCVLAEMVPDALPTVWRPLYERVRDDNRYWVLPTASRWCDDERECVCLEPYLDKDALADDWDSLLRVVRPIQACCEQ